MRRSMVIVAIVLGCVVGQASLGQTRATYMKQTGCIKASLARIDGRAEQPLIKPSDLRLTIENQTSGSLYIHQSPVFYLWRKGSDEANPKLYDAFIARIGDLDPIPPLPKKLGPHQMVSMQIHIDQLDAKNTIAAIDVWKQLLLVVPPEHYLIEAQLLSNEDGSCLRTISNRVDIEILPK